MKKLPHDVPSPVFMRGVSETDRCRASVSGRVLETQAVPVLPQSQRNPAATLDGNALPVSTAPVSTLPYSGSVSAVVTEDTAGGQNQSGPALTSTALPNKLQAGMQPEPTTQAIVESQQAPRTVGLVATIPMDSPPDTAFLPFSPFPPLPPGDPFPSRHSHLPEFPPLPTETPPATPEDPPPPTIAPPVPAEGNPPPADPQSNFPPGFHPLSRVRAPTTSTCLATEPGEVVMEEVSVEPPLQQAGPSGKQMDPTQTPPSSQWQPPVGSGLGAAQCAPHSEVPGFESGAGQKRRSPRKRRMKETSEEDRSASKKAKAQLTLPAPSTSGAKR